MLSVLTQTTVSADTDNQPEGGKKVDKLYKIHIAARFLNQGVKSFYAFLSSVSCCDSVKRIETVKLRPVII